MAKKSDHVHKFRRLKYKSGNTIFFCALPDCNQKMNVALALGKRSLCWRCNEPFIMNEYSLRLAKPHCSNCHRSKSEDKEEAPINDVSTGQSELASAANDLSVITPGKSNTVSLTLAERLGRLTQPAGVKITEKDEDI